MYCGGGLLGLGVEGEGDEGRGGAYCVGFWLGWRRGWGGGLLWATQPTTNT